MATSTAPSASTIRASTAPGSAVDRHTLLLVLITREESRPAGYTGAAWI